RTRERLEHRLDVMMARTPVQHVRVDVGARANRKALKEIVHELRLQVADAPHPQLQLDDGMRTSAEVDRSDGKRLVHRHDEVAGTIDSPTVAERGERGLAQHDS